MPLVSVIVPVYNVERYLGECLESILGQTFRDFEVILVDDGSTDKSGSICDEYAEKDARIKVFHQKNQGVSTARNFALSKVCGEYIIFCDSDDRIDPQMLQKMYSTALGTDADVVMCDFYMVLSTGNKYFRCSTWRNDDKVASMQKYLRFPWNVVWNILIKRELCERNNLRFASSYAYCEDFNFVVKVLDRAVTVENVHEPLYYYNQLNAGSVMRHLNEKTMRSEQVMYLDIIDWFNKENALNHYIKEMSWRILKSKQELVLKTATYNEYLALFPLSHNYIWSCPWLNFKLKLMMWCLVHHLRYVSILMLKLRNVKQQYVS